MKELEAKQANAMKQAEIARNDVEKVEFAKKKAEDDLA